MRLLIVNFEMDEDSPVRAWQGRIAREIAGSCEFVVVLTQRLGRFEVPGNMRVEVIPQRPHGVPSRLGGKWLVNRKVFDLCRRHRIDACFVHMAARWTYTLYPALRLLGIPILLWYAHGTVTRQLRLAHQCATRVITSTPEGFRIPSQKVRVIGQGIDTDLFRPARPANSQTDLITVSRISRRKRLDLLLAVMNSLKSDPEAAGLRLRVVGPPLTHDDHSYESELRGQVRRMGLERSVEFIGFVPQHLVPSHYPSAFLHANVSQTGSMDKTVLEALASGCPVLTTNPAFYDLLRDYPEFLVKDEEPQSIAARVLEIYRGRDRYDPGALRALVLGRHDSKSFAEKVLVELSDIVGAHL